MPSDAGWETYSKLVLQQLETLSKGIEGLRTELQDVKEQLTKIKAKEDRLEELKSWKEKIDEVASPSQIKYALRELENLKTFKTKAVTIFTVIQFGMAAVLFAMNFI
jgi:chromosome segregation ATPase|tara:strand:- start:132 stop:452 length:321 start_codon:yes stop_codon:yes gene_type:complete